MVERPADDARAEILSRVRAALGAAPRPARQALEGATGAALPCATHEQLLALFTERLHAVGGRVHVARDEADAARILTGLVTHGGADEVALSDSPLVQRLARALPSGVQTFDGWSDRKRLFRCGLGLSGAQAAIAETGTLVLESRDERHRLVSLVPPVHVAVLGTRALVPGLGDALGRLGRGVDLARAVTLVTGPSRTADIELELVVGVHGPRELHVVVLEEPAP